MCVEKHISRFTISVSAFNAPFSRSAGSRMFNFDLLRKYSKLKGRKDTQVNT